MSDERDELLAALGQLQAIVQSSIDRRTPAAEQPVGMEALLESVLASAQRAGLSPAQTAELMRGLGIVKGAQPAEPAEEHRLVAPPIPPPPLAEKPHNGTPTPAPPPDEAPGLLAEWGGDLSALAEASEAGDLSALTARDEASAPPAEPAPTDDVPDRPRFRRAQPRTIRRVSRPARLAPRRGKSSATAQTQDEAPAPRREPRRAPPSRTPAGTTDARKPSPMPPLPRRAKRPPTDEPARRPLRKVSTRPPAAAPPSKPPPILDVAVVRSQPPAPAAAMPTPPLVAQAPPPPDPGAPPSRDADRSALIDEAALALVGSIAGLEDALKRPQRKQRPAFDPVPSSSNLSSMLDVEIDSPPTFNGNWIWVDANIRSPIRRSVPSLLGHLARQGASVRIELNVGRARAVIEMRKGHLILVRTNLSGAQLGDILVARNRIPPAEQAIARALRSPRDAAAWVARTRAIDASQLHEANVEKMRINLAHCLRLPGGQFRIFPQRDGASRGRPRLNVLASLLKAVDAIPAQLALACHDTFAGFALMPGEHHAAARSLKKDEICEHLLTRRPQPEPLREVLGRIRGPRLDATRRAVLLVELEALAFGEKQERVGAQEIRREARTPVPGFNCTSLAQQFGIREAVAESLVIATLRACLVHVSSVEEPSVNDLISLARLAISRDARPAETTDADRTLLDQFKAAGLTVPEVCDFCEKLIEQLAVQGVDLHRLVPKKSVLGVLLYTQHK